MQKDSGWSRGKMRWRFRAADLCTRHKSLSATRKSIHMVFKGNSPIVICLNLQSFSPTFISSVARTTGLWSLKRVKEAQQKQLQLRALFDVSSIFSLFQFGLSCVAHFTESRSLWSAQLTLLSSLSCRVLCTSKHQVTCRSTIHISMWPVQQITLGEDMMNIFSCFVSRLVIVRLPSPVFISVNFLQICFSLCAGVIFTSGLAPDATWQ